KSRSFVVRAAQDDNEPLLRTRFYGWSCARISPPGKLPGTCALPGTPLEVWTFTYAFPARIALRRSASGCPASGPTRVAALNSPLASNPLVRPIPVGPGATAVPGNSH